MFDALPAPLTPADCDLRDFAFMPLDVQRLRDSDMAAIEDAEAFRGAVLAWCVAWHQVPAASLPDDDAILCRLLGYGRDLTTWRRVRAAGALRGFTVCSDGRLYHATVAEKALDAWGRKRDAREAGKRGAEKRWSQKKTTTNRTAQDAATPPEADGDPIGTPFEMNGDPNGQPTVFDSKGQGQGQGQEESKQAARDLRLVSGPVRWDDGAIKPAGIDPRKPPDHPDNIRDRDRPCVNGFYLDWTFEQAMEAAGIDPARSTATWKPVVEWLKAGIDPATIKAAIRRCAERSAYRPPTSLAWFDGAVREQRAAA